VNDSRLSALRATYPKNRVNEIGAIDPWLFPMTINMSSRHARTETAPRRSWAVSLSLHLAA
jgi:hypothetical protein